MNSCIVALALELVSFGSPKSGRAFTIFQISPILAIMAILAISPRLH